VARTSPEQNKALVLEAFDALFNRRDYAAAERYWSDHYIQHSAHIEPGRDGLFNLVRASPDTLRDENQLILAEGDYVTRTVVSPAMDGRWPGSPPISSASKTTSLPNIGMCCRTKRRKPSRRADFLCSAIVSRIDPPPSAQLNGARS
jgi:hypothetical protein